MSIIQSGECQQILSYRRIDIINNKLFNVFYRLVRPHPTYPALQSFLTTTEYKLLRKFHGRDKRLARQETSFVQGPPSWYRVTSLGSAGGGLLGVNTLVSFGILRRFDAQALCLVKKLGAVYDWQVRDVGIGWGWKVVKAKTRAPPNHTHIADEHALQTQKGHIREAVRRSMQLARL